jgi:hypothetical protein
MIAKHHMPYEMLRTSASLHSRGRRFDHRIVVAGVLFARNLLY